MINSSIKGGRKMTKELNKRAISNLKSALIILQTTNKFNVKNFKARQDILQLIEYLKEEQK